jgi:protein phosphatase 2C family protein 2/3
MTIIIEVSKPKNRRVPQPWPTVSFFGLYDGHGGRQCAEFLQQNLHRFIIESSYFPKTPTEAILDGFKQAEAAFSRLNQPSGSCAVVVMVVNSVIYAANVGDSRAVLVSNAG